MARLIDADALLEQAYYVIPYKDLVVDVLDIENAPTVDAVPVVHGRWDKGEPDKYGCRKHKCSVCGVYRLGYWSDFMVCNYCPNCGEDGSGGGVVIKKRAIYLSFNSHDCEAWYKCPECGKAFGSWSVFTQEKNENGSNHYCPFCKVELDGLG